MARETEPSDKTPQDGDRPDDDTGKKTTAATATAQGGDEGDEAGDGFAQLRSHHKTLRALLGETAGLTDADQADDLLRRLSAAWARHAEAHGSLYEAGAEAGLQEFAPLTETAIRTDLVSFLLRAGRDLEGPLALAALRVAARMIGEIIEGEEKPRSGLLAKAKAAGVDPAALGRHLGAGQTRPSGEEDGETMPRLRHLTADQEDNMPRNSNMPERDEYGRFVSDDDRGGRGRSSGRYDDDRERDSRGRFMSDRDDDRGRSRGGRDDDRGYSRSSRSYDDDRRSSSRRYDDDDRSYSRDRGQGGWFGDSEGHAEAARRGWDHRRDDDDDRDYGRGRSSRRDDDDDDRRYSRGRDDDRERDSRGRFTSGRDDDDRRSYGRGRDDDDRGGSSRDRGQGGWFGDSRGHAEAARRGWDHRRDDDDDRDYGRGRSSRRDDDDDDRRYSRGRR